MGKMLCTLSTAIRLIGLLDYERELLVKQEATPLKDFPECTHWQAEVDRALRHFAHTPREITVLMAQYCATLGVMAA
jgi:hypothetical protein